MTTTIDDLEEAQLEQHLIAGGFLGAFTDILGRSQPAPKLQIFELNTTDLAASERAIMIRTIGGVTSPVNRTLHKIRNMIIVVCGKTSEEDRIVVRGLAEDIEKYLVANPTDDGCIFNIVSSGVSGAFTLPDSRRICEVNLQVSFNI